MSSTAHLLQMFELHRRARACVGGWSKGGQEGQALGRSRGGFTTKIHAKSDASGDIIAFDLTGGEAFDGRHFEIHMVGSGAETEHDHFASWSDEGNAKVDKSGFANAFADDVRTARTSLLDPRGQRLMQVATVAPQ